MCIYSNAGARFFFFTTRVVFWCELISLENKIGSDDSDLYYYKIFCGGTRFPAIEPRRVNSAVQTKPSVTFHKNVRQLWRCISVNVLTVVFRNRIYLQ
jgi:hypothetical protein